LGADVKQVLGLDQGWSSRHLQLTRLLSVLGLARESAVTLGVPFKKPDTGLRKRQVENAADYASVEIKNPELCPRYVARIVKDVKVGPSPEWMQIRLAAAGMRPISNIVDITNYVMLELGQPMHAFSLDQVKGSKIIVRTAKEGEVLKTLDGQERKLDTTMLVIADEDRPNRVAGVMGGENSEITG
jgi:phenylalanyl-tRNA synthetase beta chain